MTNNLSDPDKEKLLKILADILSVHPDQLTEDARLFEDFQADSLTIAELILALEEEFEITIPDEKAEEVKTVRDVFRVLSELLSQIRH